MHILEKKYTYQINDLSFHLNKLEKEEKITQRNQKKENEDNRKKINYIENTKTKGKINKTKSHFFKKIKI